MNSLKKTKFLNKNFYWDPLPRIKSILEYFSNVVKKNFIKHYNIKLLFFKG